MPLVLTNALLVDLDPPRVERGGLRIDDSRIAVRGDVTIGAATRWSIAAGRW